MRIAGRKSAELALVMLIALSCAAAAEAQLASPGTTPTATAANPAAEVSAAMPAAAEPAANELRDCAECPALVIIPAGTFRMGTPAAELVDVESASVAESQPVTIRIPVAFAIGRTEVTRAEFRQFIDDSGYEIGVGCRTWDESLQRFRDDRARSWLNPGRPRELRDDQPVSCVSWTDARAYAQWLTRKTGKSYRLPSEAEWEYAARAGSTGLRPWGDKVDGGCAYANSYDSGADQEYHLGWSHADCDDGFHDVAPAGALQPNAYGVYDMIGNLWEWTEDCATGSYVGRPKDARPWVWLGGCSRHVQRGGGWLTPPARSRSAYRGDGDGDDRSDFLGFRVARTLDAPAVAGAAP